MSNLIGVFGGTFDPVHLGHKTLAESAVREANLDKLIVMPTRIQPFKQGKTVTEGRHRQKMVELTFNYSPKIEISNYELESTTISYTYDTLLYIMGKYSDSEIYFVCGTDSFLSLDRWYKGTDILKNFGIIVSSRPQYRETELKEKVLTYQKNYNTKIIVLKSQMPDISATEIRDRIKSQKPCADLITKEVERYIYENGLYK